MISTEGITPLIQELFACRTDVFAKRWEDGKKSGYMPVVTYDPYNLKQHQIKGGSFKDFTDKDYKPLTKEELEKHLKGEQSIGIYPLLKDNTSWFIVADFDEDNWIEQCQLFINVCNEKGICLIKYPASTGFSQTRICYQVKDLET